METEFARVRQGRSIDSCRAASGSDNRFMGIDQAQPAEAVARLADAALRLRAVREAEAHFLAMWRIERELDLTRPNARAGIRFERDLHLDAPGTED